MLSKEALQELIKAEPRAALVVNTRSRAGRRLYSQALELLARRGLLLQEVHPVQDPERLPKIVADAVEQGSNLIIVGGGDGTVSSIVDRVAYRDAVLGILPLGTSNAFARTLSLPLQLPDAVEVIGAGRVADVDLGVVNGDYFANVASLGLSAGIAHSIPHRLKRRLGSHAYALVGMGVLVSKEVFHCQVHAPEHEIAIDTRQIVIANGRFVGTALLGPGAHPENRHLGVFDFGKSRLQFLKSWSNYFLGRNPFLKRTNLILAPEFHLEADPPQWIDVDGEIRGQTPATFKVAFDALKVLVPQDFVELW